MLLSEDGLRELQKIELDIFKQFKEICEKLNVKYYLMYGTLLGAVRHKGFIPWDDDIDVGIMRDDYERFIKLAQEYLPKHLFLQNYKSDKGYVHAFSKIRNSDTSFIETSIKENKMNHGIFIDIFPLDFCNADTGTSFAFNLKKSIYNLQISYLFSDCTLDCKQRLIRGATKILCPDPHNALKKLDKLYQSMPNGKMVANFSGYGAREIMSSEWYGEGKTLTFEGEEVVVPSEYEKWLTQVYGDYMQLPPIEKRVTHHLTEVIDTKNSYKKYMDEQ